MFTCGRSFSVVIPLWDQFLWEYFVAVATVSDITTSVDTLLASGGSRIFPYRVR